MQDLTLCDSVGIVQPGQIYRERKQISGCLGLGCVCV